MTLEESIAEFRRVEDLHLARPNISTRQLRVFVEVYRERSITDAADMLLISQPTVSRALKSLEDRLGVALFERAKNGLVPTTAGDMLHPRAVAALAAIDDALSELSVSPTTHRLAVGIIPELVALIAPAIRTFGEQEDGVARMESWAADRLLNGLADKSLDLVFVPALGDQVLDWEHREVVGTIGVGLHTPDSGIRSELLALPPEGSWERDIIRGLIGGDPKGPTFETSGGGLAKRLIREGFSAYLPVACASDLTDVSIAGAVYEVAVYALARNPIAPRSKVRRFIDITRTVMPASS